MINHISTIYDENHTELSGSIEPSAVYDEN